MVMKKQLDATTIIFWITIVFYLDPGGYLAISIPGSRYVIAKFFLTAIAWSCYMLIKHRGGNKSIDTSFIKRITYILLVWYAYYFLWYYGLNNNSFPGFFRVIIRNSRMINQGLLVIPIVYFALRGLGGFTYMLKWSTVVIASFFILSVVFNINLIQFSSGNRGLGSEAIRYAMYGYGIITFVIPMTIAMLLFKFKTDRVLLFAGILTLIISILAIVRRELIGIVEAYIILFFLINYINRKSVFKFLSHVFSIRNILYITLFFIFVSAVFPNVVEVSRTIVVNTYYSIFEANGADAARLSLKAKTGIITAIEENLFLGTGFDADWMTADGGVNEWEGSDYIFLSAFAMYGLVGLLVFLPFYILTIKIIIRLLKLLRNELQIIRKYSHIFFYPVIIGLASASEFIRNIIEYPNWFFPIGATLYSPKYFIYFGLLLGSYYSLKWNIDKINQISRMPAR